MRGIANDSTTLINLQITDKKTLRSWGTSGLAWIGRRRSKPLRPRPLNNHYPDAGARQAAVEAVSRVMDLKSHFGK